MLFQVRKLVKRRVLASLDEYGKRTPRRSHQYHTTNGSCGVPTTSEVVMAVSYRRSTQDQSTIADPDQYTEMKPFTSECGESWASRMWTCLWKNWYKVCAIEQSRCFKDQVLLPKGIPCQIVVCKAVHRCNGTLRKYVIMIKHWLHWVRLSVQMLD